ncbi:hypothetical protein [Enterobacter cancerogenus]|uniref:hypothetical protein n=1 Tax=Enterobacter cancerogenus TaxID=69218 RepID=UPI004059E369
MSFMFEVFPGTYHIKYFVTDRTPDDNAGHIIAATGEVVVINVFFDQSGHFKIVPSFVIHERHFPVLKLADAQDFCRRLRLHAKEYP